MSTDTHLLWLLDGDRAYPLAERVRVIPLGAIGDTLGSPSASNSGRNA